MALWSDEDAGERRPEGGGGAKALVRALAGAAGILVLVLAAGTVYGLAAGTRQKKLALEADKAQVAAELVQGAAFSAIGTVRAKSADAKSAVVVATIAFPYDAADGPFAEELVRKAPVLKAIAQSVLSSKKAADLVPAYEGSLKAALRDAFNARLSLGKVNEIWLSDFAVIQ
jgi:flagellar basal body-associated protein FliL